MQTQYEIQDLDVKIKNKYTTSSTIKVFYDDVKMEQAGKQTGEWSRDRE